MPRWVWCAISQKDASDPICGLPERHVLENNINCRGSLVAVHCFLDLIQELVALDLIEEAA